MRGNLSSKGEAPVTLVLGLAMLAAAGAAGYQLLYRPRAMEVGALRSQMQQERQTRDRRLEVGRQLDELQTAMQAVSPKADSSWLGHEAIQVAREAGIQVKRMTQNEAKRDSDHTRLSINLDLEATYDQLGSFIDLLERNRRFIWIERMDVKPVDKDQTRLSVDMQLNSIYVAPLDSLAQ